MGLPTVAGDAGGDEKPLPEGWTKNFSNTWKKDYYFNAKTGKQIWDHPSTLAAASPAQSSSKGAVPQPVKRESAPPKKESAPSGGGRRARSARLRKRPRMRTPRGGATRSDGGWARAIRSMGT